MGPGAIAGSFGAGTPGSSPPLLLSQPAMRRVAREVFCCCLNPSDRMRQPVIETELPFAAWPWRLANRRDRSCAGINRPEGLKLLLPQFPGPRKAAVGCTTGAIGCDWLRRHTGSLPLSKNLLDTISAALSARATFIASCVAAVSDHDSCPCLVACTSLRAARKLKLLLRKNCPYRPPKPRRVQILFCPCRSLTALAGARAEGPSSA